MDKRKNLSDFYKGQNCDGYRPGSDELRCSSFAVVRTDQKSGHIKVKPVMRRQGHGQPGFTDVQYMLSKGWPV